MSKVYMMVTITNRQLRNQFQDLFEKMRWLLFLEHWEEELQTVPFWIISDWRQAKKRCIFQS